MTTLQARGVLTVQATYWLGHALLVPLLPSFIERYPKVDVTLELKDFANLSTHDWDVQITAGTLADSDHAAVRMTQIALRLYASKKYLSRYGAPRDITELSRHSVVDKHWTRGTSPWVNDIGAQPVTIRPRLVVNDMMAIAQAVRAGAGIGWLPGFLAEASHGADGVVNVLPALQPAPMPVYAIFQRRRTVSPKVRAFIDFLGESFGSRR